jgi:hypothetical protein
MIAATPVAFPLWWDTKNARTKIRNLLGTGMTTKQKGSQSKAE